MILLVIVDILEILTTRGPGNGASQITKTVFTTYFLCLHCLLTPFHLLFCPYQMRSYMEEEPHIV